MAKSNRVVPTVALALLAGLPGIAAAQLEEIVVTANRRAESEQTVPISITALTASDLTNNGLNGVSDLGTVTPGLNMNIRSVFWVPTIRGIGTLDVSAGQETAIATYIDGVYISNVMGADAPFNNLERIEVLKGPQGTLFGRNATGGAIQIITKDPTQEPTLDAKIGYGNYDTVSGDFYASGGITDTVAADLAVHYFDQSEPWGYDVTTNTPLAGLRQIAFRNKWVAKPADGTKLTVIFDYSKRDGGVQGDARNLLPGSVGLGGLTALANYYDVRGDFPFTRQVQQGGVSVKYEQEFSAFNFVSITADRALKNLCNFDNDSSPFQVVGVYEHQTITTFTQELQFLSKNAGNFTWIAGAFFMYDKNGWANPNGIRLFGTSFPDPINGLPASLSSSNFDVTHSISVFGEGTYRFTDTTRLVAGVRWTQDKKSLVDDYTGVYRYNGDLLTTIAGPDSSVTYRKPTWRLVLDHDITDQMMVYGSYNRGYRAGTYNSVFPTGVPVNPEIVDAFEVGAKSRFLDGKLQLNGAAYYDKYKDLQVTIAEGPAQAVVNAAKAKIEGVELEAIAQPIKNLEFRLGANYLYTKYQQFAIAPCSPRLPDGTTGSSLCNPTGNPSVRAPPVTFNVGGTYSVPIVTGASVGGSVNYFWTDHFNWEPDGRLEQAAYGLLEATLFWTSKDSKYTVRAYGKNLTGTEYSVFSVSQPGIGDAYAAGAPRTYGVEFEAKL